jgi:hypothetical protein
VVDWVTSTFRECNARISEKLTNNPNLPEESLDLTWIEHFSQLTSPITLSSSWTVKFETHFLGGLRHFRRWEIADIGVLLFIRRGGRIARSKVALLQSKRLYPTTNQVREEHLIDYMTGFARLADPEDLQTSIAVQTEFEFNVGEDEDRLWNDLSESRRRFLEEDTPESRARDEDTIKRWSQIHGPSDEEIAARAEEVRQKLRSMKRVTVGRLE